MLIIVVFRFVLGYSIEETILMRIDVYKLFYLLMNEAPSNDLHVNWISMLTSQLH